MALMAFETDDKWFEVFSHLRRQNCENTFIVYIITYKGILIPLAIFMNWHKELLCFHHL